MTAIRNDYAQKPATDAQSLYNIVESKVIANLLLIALSSSNRSGHNPTYAPAMLRLFLLTALCLLVHTTSWAKPDYTQLAKHPTWLKLGHYKAPLFNKSYVISDHFFLAENGHTNPHAELLATVTKFNQHPESQCRFPARYQWLTAQG